MAGSFGNIGSAHVTVELDFLRAVQEAQGEFSAKIGQALGAAGKEGSAAFASTLEPGVANAGAVAGKEAGVELASTFSKGAAVAGKEGGAVFGAELGKTAVTESAVVGKESGASFARGFGSEMKLAAAAASQRFSSVFTAASVRSSALAGKIAGSEFAIKFRAAAAAGAAATGKLLRAALLPVGIAIAAVGLELKAGAADAKVMSDAMISLRGALKIAGPAAGITARQVRTLAGSFETLTSISEESIITSIGALTRFGVVTKKNLKPTTKLFLDAAVGLRQVNEQGDIAPAFAAKFARAMNDPAKGLALIAKAGGTVTKQQKDLVKQLVSTGKAAQATSLVQDLLAKSFTGEAARLGTGIRGQLRIATDAFQDARRDIATRILPSIVPVIKNTLGQLAAVLSANQKPIAEFVTGFVKGAGAVLKFITTSKPFHNILSGIASVIAGVAGGLKGFASSFGKAFSKGNGKSAKDFGDTVKALGDRIGKIARDDLPKLGTALGAVAGFFAQHTTALKVLVGLLVAYKAISVVTTAVILAFNAALLVVRTAVIAYTAAQWLLNIALSANPIGLIIIAVAALGIALFVLWKKSKTFRTIVVASFKAVKDFAIAAFTKTKNFLVSSFNAMVAFIVKWGPLFLAVITGPIGLAVLAIIKNWNRIKEATKNTFNAIREKVHSAISAVKNFLTGIDLSKVGSRMIHGLLDGIKAGFEDVKAFVSKIAGIIKKLKGPISFDRKLLVPEGGAIMQGFEKGLRSRWSGVKDWVSNIGQFFKGVVNPDSLRLDIANILLGKGSVDDLNKKLSGQLGLNLSSVAGGIVGANGLHPTSGWPDTLAQANLLSKLFHVGITSGLRQIDTVPGPGVSQHVLGQAADFGTSKGSNANLTSLAAFTSKMVASIFKQVIWKNSLWQGGTPGHGFVANHMDHVHLGWQPRAAGGGVRKGNRYQVNERGREMFIPQENGYVMNASRTKELVSAIRSIAQKPSNSTNNAPVINVQSNATDPRAVAQIAMSNLGGVFSRA